MDPQDAVREAVAPPNCAFAIHLPVHVAKTHSGGCGNAPLIVDPTVTASNQAPDHPQGSSHSCCRDYGKSCGGSVDPAARSRTLAVRLRDMFHFAFRGGILGADLVKRQLTFTCFALDIIPNLI